MKNKGKNKSGISLIVLVITIIVIVILSVSVILTVAKNNPIENARKAVDEHNKSVMKEEISLSLINNMTKADPVQAAMDELVESGYEIVGDEKLKKDGYIFTIGENNEITVENDNEKEEYIAINTAEDFINIKNNTAGKYILKNDIDFSGVNLEAISEFSGELNGNGKTISNLEASRGLVITNKGTIKNINIVSSDFNISSDSFTYDASRNGADYSIGIIAESNAGKISNCKLAGINYITVNLSEDIDYDIFVDCGSFVGANLASGVIENCDGYLTDLCLKGTQNNKSTGFVNAGGICGINMSGGKISGCSSNTFNIKNDIGINVSACFGGIAGDSSGNIENCKAVLSPGSESFASYGGVVGYNNGDIKNCEIEVDTNSTFSDYEVVGGIFAEGDATPNSHYVENCIIYPYESDTNTDFGAFYGASGTAQFKNCYAIGNFEKYSYSSSSETIAGCEIIKDTEEAKKKSKYADELWNNGWNIDEGKSYPYLTLFK